MPPKALKQILFKVESTNQFLELVDPSNKKLVGKSLLHLNPGASMFLI